MSQDTNRQTSLMDPSHYHERLKGKIKHLRAEVNKMTKLCNDLRSSPPLPLNRAYEALNVRLRQSIKELCALQEAILYQEKQLQVLEVEFSDLKVWEGPSVTEHVQNLQARIDSTGQTLSNMQFDLVAKHSIIDEIENSLSPIRILPMDILTEIFDYFKETRLSASSGIPPLLYITNVCSSWRSTAINKSGLWASIRITLEEGQMNDGWASLVSLWLERSRDVPFSFSIKDLTGSNQGLPISSVSFRILDLLRVHSHRWKDVKFYNAANISWCLKAFLDLHSHVPFALLESITVMSHTVDDIQVRRLLDMLTKAPRLRSITWGGQFSEFDTFKLPWSLLTKLDIRDNNVSAKQLLNVLSKSGQLKIACVQLVAEKAGFDNDLYHIAHQNLQTLHLQYTGDLKSFFDFVAFPKLGKLEIAKMNALPRTAPSALWPQESFISFLQRSRCEIRAFDLSSSEASDVEILAILKHMSPSLTRLNVTDRRMRGCITDEIIKPLTYPPSASGSPTRKVVPASKTQNLGAGSHLHDCASSITAISEYTENGKEREDASSTLCPNLRHIDLWGCVSTDGVLADMVTSRRNPPVGKEYSNLRNLLSGSFTVKRRLPQDATRLADVRGGRIFYHTVPDIFDV
ncbi:hypothetical protein CPB84DRAFT_1842536 [Gymnopilus junonius]|uniref:F-box domain-containing protein n=1 Tax=Gymnopilus junonius TaxID=109634 RepID=A0A9P5NW05_GYMJU|nr:hypothetical protein CPB84DRAFT_1842536 [Gymnopilus junonius]